jgi:ABC-type dipeptide/oligopeptide/nickel transport system permease subunit
MTAATDILSPAGPSAPSGGEPAYASTSVLRLFWDRFREDKAAVFALCVIVLLVLIAIGGGPLAAKITGHTDLATFPGTMENTFGIPKGPNSQFWFGADNNGRDLFVLTMYGARTSLLVGVVASGIAILIGLVVGMIAGFYRGWIDSLFSRVGDVMLAMPQLLISIGIVAACSTTKEGCLDGFIQPGMRVVIAVIVIFTWPYIARIVRGFTLSLREREFVEASRSLGASNTRIIFREILPNLGGPMLVWATLTIPQAILFEAALSYLGLGVSPDTPSWGGLLNQATLLYDVAWWLILFPGLFLVITTLAFNLLGDGLRDALDVRADR